MCVIIDAEAASHVFSSVGITGDYCTLIRWIRKLGGAVVFGGKNGRELFVVKEARDAIQEWVRSGRAINISEKEIGDKEAEAKGTCSSNDVHVIALALASHVRLLCVSAKGDKALQKDFKRLRKPKGRVYRNSSHQHLLAHTPGCPAYQRES